MNNCLDNYIGIIGCDVTPPISGLYINDLYGINLQSIDAIADADQITFMNVWASVQKRAIKRFETDVINFFRTRYKVNRLIDRTFVGTMTDPADTLPPATELRGIVVTMNPNRTDPELSPLLTIGISMFEFWSESVAPVSARFTIADSDTANIMFDGVVDLVEGWNTIFAEWKTGATEFPRNMIVVVFADNVTTINTKIGTDSDGCGCGCGCLDSKCCTAEITGLIVDQATREQTITAGNGHGFRGFVSLTCSFDGLICSNRALFASAIWYLHGVEMMNERLFSDRINKYTTTDRTKAEQLRTEFSERYQTEMDAVISGISLNDFDCCIDCDPQVESAEHLP